MASIIDRRYLLRLFASAPVAWALHGFDRVWSQANAPRVIDVHCHIFNAADVPVRGFVQRVVLGDEEDQIIIEPDPSLREAVIPAFVAFLVALLSKGAPTAKQELERLKAGVELETSTESEFEKQVADALEFVLSGQAPGVPEEGRKRLRESIIKEIGASPDADYRTMARGLSSGRGPRRRYVRLARKYLGYRGNLLREAAKLYDGPDGVQLFTPALLDLRDWIDGTQGSDLESQICLMERMQRMNWGKAHMHGFVPFNPWRQIEDKTVFDLVKHAVMCMGFVGVKVYPPMGFLPIGNEGSGLPYPRRAGEIPNFLPRLDAALDALYAWAAEECVPIMAHATNSQGAAPGYAERGRPDHWAPVLKKYPRLRLNLGHFGGFDKEEVGEGGELEKTWEYYFGRLLRDADPPYPNVFADMSYLSEVLPRHDRRAQLLQYLRAFLKKFDPKCSRLMYGSDFALIVREQRYENYLKDFRSYISELKISDADRSRLYSANAVKFLGLNKNARTRNRLEAYYRDRKLDAKWLSDFDSEPKGLHE